MTPKCGWNVEEGRPWAAGPLDRLFASAVCVLCIVAIVSMVATAVLCG